MALYTWDYPCGATHLLVCMLEAINLTWTFLWWPHILHFSNWCGDWQRIDLMVKKLVTILGHHYDKKIGIWCWDDTCGRCNMLPNEVIVDLNMFGPLMKNWIGGNLDSACIFSTKQIEINKTPSSWSKSCSQITSLLAKDRYWYSPSGEDFETVVCFLNFQEISDVLRNMHYLSSGWSSSAI